MSSQSLRIGIDVHSPRIDGNLDRLEQDLAVFERDGFDVVEIPVHGVDAIIAGKLWERRVKDIQAVLRQFKLAYTVHAPDFLNLWDIAHIKEQINVFKSSIRFAGKIGATHLVYHQGRIPELSNGGPIGEGKARQKEIEQLKKLGDFAADNGVIICVENIPSVFRDVSDLITVVGTVSHSHVRICLDLGHAFLIANEMGFDFLASVQHAKPWVEHIHIHDNFGLHLEGDPKFGYQIPYIFKLPYGIGDLHLPVGWGKIPFEAVFDTFRDYQGIWLIELKPRYSEEHKNILRAIRQGLASPETTRKAVLSSPTPRRDS